MFKEVYVVVPTANRIIDGAWECCVVDVPGANAGAGCAAAWM